MESRKFIVFLSLLILLQSTFFFIVYAENGEGIEGYAEIVSVESPSTVELNGVLTVVGSFQYAFPDLSALSVRLSEAKDGTIEPDDPVLDYEEFLVEGEGIQSFNLSAAAPSSEKEWNLVVTLWFLGITEWSLVSEYNFTVTVTSLMPLVEITSFTLSNYEPSDGDEVTVTAELTFTDYMAQEEVSVNFMVDGDVIHEEAVTVPPTETYTCDLSFEWTAVEGTHEISVEVLEETEKVEVSVSALEPTLPPPSGLQIDPIWIIGGAAAVGLIGVGAYMLQRGKQKPPVTKPAEPSAMDRWFKEGPDEKLAAEWTRRKESLRRQLKKMYKESGVKVGCRTSFEWMFHEMDLRVYPIGGETRIPEDKPLPMKAAAYDKHVLIQKCDCQGEELDDLSSKNHILYANVMCRWQIIGGEGGFVWCEGDKPAPLEDGDQVLFQPPVIEDEKETRKVTIKVTARHSDRRKPPKHDPCVVTYEMEMRREKNEYVYSPRILSKECPKTNPLPREEEGDCIPSHEWRAGSPIENGKIVAHKVREVACGDLCVLRAYANDVDELLLRCDPVDPSESRVTPICELSSEETLNLPDLLLFSWKCDKGRFPLGAGGSNIDSRGRHTVWQAPDKEGKVKIKLKIFDRMVFDEQYDDKKDLNLEIDVNVRKREKLVKKPKKGEKNMTFEPLDEGFQISSTSSVSVPEPPDLEKFEKTRKEWERIKKKHGIKEQPRKLTKKEREDLENLPKKPKPKKKPKKTKSKKKS